MTITKNDLNSGIGIVDLLAEKTNIFPSKGEAKKMVMAGGVSMNKVKVADTNVTVTTADLLRDKYLILQKGKKQYFLLTAI
ncbi:MAG: Tyrosine--tRNA ligase 1 [Bacteroidetes bacterium ADurb.Bin397]|nr:MAG: Tyrosine--tRNA ligase 1 [Bacteroidetes bacterium ADurb.Bin397]